MIAFAFPEFMISISEVIMELIWFFGVLPFSILNLADFLTSI